ncbi:serine/threonine-protein kinase [Streptomyces fulvoviolaceus]|uniref:serine/threonine-protein kinase n=1 Tax=Streptomyces fulvoviolaceus TaxID=285535 RepID=UPI0004C640A5|nr:serine/threonine-protein kinase [Streptomyces fulvoviolaceus]
MQALRETDPRRIGPYEVLGRLGAGGMGEVYLAESPTGLRLAVKVVRAEHAEDRTFRARFRQEVRAAQTVGGAGTYVARVVDADTEGEQPWMATEFVDGPNLRDAVLDHGPLPGDAVRVLAAALAEALVAIHSRGMVHRDLKPSNILLAADGPRVIDFGIVRALEATALTRTGAVVGSVGYVSPEQIRNNGQVGPPSDVFALGAVLAYAAAGREPFGEGKDAVILMRVLTRDFDLSGVPEDIRGSVEPCLREEPEQRPTPGEVMSAVGHTARSLRESVRPGWYTAAGAGPSEDAERWLPDRDSGERESRVEYLAPLTVTDVPAAVPTAPSRRRLLRGLGAGALLAAGAGTGGWLWLRDGDGDGGRNPRSVEAPVVAWTQATSELTTGGGDGPCVALSPEGDTVYAGGNDGKLYALTRAGGALWTADLGAPVTSPVATADVVCCLVASSSGTGTEACALDPKGRVLWRHAIEESEDMLPVAAGSLVLVTTGHEGTAGRVRAYRPDGGVAWETRNLEVSREPLVANGVAYLATRDDEVVALNATDGTQLWNVPAGTSPGRPALVGDTLVVGSDSDENVHGISLTGQARWHVANTDVAPREYGYATYTDFTAFGDVALTRHAGPLVAVDPADGSTAWTFEGTDEVETDPTVFGETAYVVLDRMLYGVDRNGIRQRTVRLTKLILDTSHRPVVSGKGDRVYLGGEGGIIALDLPD